jgi:hypothetical protein
MKILVKYPTRARPDLFRKTLALYLADPSAQVLISADMNDAAMNVPEMRSFIESQPRTECRWGRSRTKVEAINDGVAEAKWDLLILASDDMIPQRQDYAARIRQIFQQHFPGGDGVLHLDDGRSQRRLNTLVICDRKYFDRTGYIYHPDYISVFCDDEFQAVSERLGRAVYVGEIIIRHEWTNVTGRDALHIRNESHYETDAVTFRARRAAGFP